MAGEKTQFNDVDHSQLLDIKQNNLVATVAPAVTDDSASGYAVNSEWIDITADKAYKCVDASVGAAVWKETTQAGLVSPLTTKGDLFTFSTVDARLPVGANGYIIEADSAEATGLKYSKKPWNRVFWAYNMVAAAGYTWNGVSNIGAPGATALYSRHRFFAFAGNGTSKEGVYMNYILPQDYVAGTNVKVTIKTTSNVAGGNYIFTSGLCRPFTGAFSGLTEANTEWIASAGIATSTGWNIASTTFTFDGTNLNPGDPVSLMIYRNASLAGDTENGDVYMNSVIVEPV